VFFCERIREDHDVSRFSSTNDELDEWLNRSALTSDRSGISRSYVLVDDGNDVVAFFALAPHVVLRDQTPKSIARTAPDEIPAILLAKLALASHLRGQGHGAALLAVALGVALEAIRIAGGRLIVVDAIDANAASFYKHEGFQPVPGNDARLVMKASVAAASLGIPWP